MSDLMFELRFESLFKAGRGYSFRCNAEGRVDIDQMSHHCKNNYLYARAMVGHEFSMPVVLVADGGSDRSDNVDA